MNNHIADAGKKVRTPLRRTPMKRTPTRCRHCKERFVPARPGQVVHEDCAPEWAERNREKRLAKEEKVRLRDERARDRQRKEAVKTLPQLKADAQREFNNFIRERDRLAGHPCISSGKPLDWTGNGVDAGHYRSVGAAPHLRYDPANCHAQTKQDNRYGSGRAVEYRIGLIARIGLAEVERLEADNEPRKFTRDELIAIKETYRRKARELKEKQG